MFVIYYQTEGGKIGKILPGFSASLQEGPWWRITKIPQGNYIYRWRDSSFNEISDLHRHANIDNSGELMNIKVLKKPQYWCLNGQNKPQKSRAGHNGRTFLIITHINLPRAFDANQNTQRELDTSTNQTNQEMHKKWKKKESAGLMLIYIFSYTFRLSVNK